MRERKQHRPAPVFSICLPERSHTRTMGDIWRAMAAQVWRLTIKSVQDQLDAQRRHDAEIDAESKRQNGQSH